MTITGEALMADSVPYHSSAPIHVGASRGNFTGKALRTPSAPADGPPDIQTVSPSSGSNGGGTAVTLTGTFTAPLNAVSPVTFGGGPAGSVVKVNNTTITCTTPAAIPGAVDVVVTDNQSRTGTKVNGYTFV